MIAKINEWLNVDKWHEHVSLSHKNCNAIVSHIQSGANLKPMTGQVQNSKQIRIGFAWAYIIYLLPSVLINDYIFLKVLVFAAGYLKTTLFPDRLIQNLWIVNQSESELWVHPALGIVVFCEQTVGSLWACCLRLRLALHLLKIMNLERLQSKGILYTHWATLRKCCVIEHLTHFP